MDVEAPLRRRNLDFFSIEGLLDSPIQFAPNPVLLCRASLHSDANHHGTVGERLDTERLERCQDEVLIARILCHGSRHLLDDGGDPIDVLAVADAHIEKRIGVILRHILECVHTSKRNNVDRAREITKRDRAKRQRLDRPGVSCNPDDVTDRNPILPRSG